VSVAFERDGLHRTFGGAQQIEIQQARGTGAAFGQCLLEPGTGALEAIGAGVAAGPAPLVQQPGGVIEACPGEHRVEVGHALSELIGDRALHRQRARPAAAGATGAIRVKQQGIVALRDIGRIEGALAARDTRHRRDQQIDLHRLGQEAVETGGVEPFPLFGAAVGGQRDDARPGCEPALAVDSLPGLAALHVGHVQVHQDQVEVPGARLVDCLMATGSQHQLGDPAAKRGTQEALVDFVVIDRQHRKGRENFDRGVVHACHYIRMPRRCNNACPGISANRLARGGLVAGCVPATLAALLLAGPAAALELDLQARSLRAGDWSAERLEVHRSEALTASLHDLRGPNGAPLGRLRLDCVSGAACPEARVEWAGPGSAQVELRIAPEASGWRIDSAPGEVWIGFTDAGRVRLDGSLDDLGEIPDGLSGVTGLAALEGRLAFDGHYSAAGGAVRLALRDGGFDTPDGRLAGAGLDADLDAEWGAGAADITVSAQWLAGEALLGPVYLAPPSPRLEVELGLSGGRVCAWAGGRLEVTQGEGLSVSARLDAPGCDAPPEATMVGVRALTLERLWALGGQSLAAAAGWGELQPRGRLQGSLALRGGIPMSADVTLSEVSLDDPKGRLGLDGVGGRLRYDPDGAVSSLRLDWRDATLYRLALGGASLRLATDADGVLRLSAPLEVPVADGRLVVERLEWRDWQRFAADVELDARVEPISLAAVSAAFDWVEFGGSVSGRFPGLEVRDGVIAFDGGFEVAMFDGSASVGALTLERPFGALPALSADVVFDDLDLAMVTGAFEFGHMTGRLSGYLRELRLLDWQPVRFDAWFGTREDVPSRRISQQAVDSLSTLGGGGGAALSGTLLQIFEDFPYRRVGLGCQLENNVCRMRGLEATEGGGYLIVEGRPLPVLNVVGHRQRVDWPRLLAQLAAVTGTR